ncbi:hypothetical protein BG015_006827 [Linnemannia schmuckeri]|uniref:HCP-like protein n=1 Tax=Linnemannia schmuckeri TaxID=64567 RepID=A0A9P5S2X0_9FUNG|nr:hypothetical protein BG015_006827 [Linnemannia schmuckeri]
MIRNSTTARQVIASHSAHSTTQRTRPGVVLFRAKRRRAGTHAVFSDPSSTTIVREYVAQPTTPVTRHIPSAAPLTPPSSYRAVASPLRSATASARFSTTPSIHLSKKHVATKHAEKSTVVKAGSAAIEGDVIYRKEGGKIVPVARDVTDQVEAPVSGLFSQFEDFKKPSSAPETLTPRLTNSQEVDLSTLTVADVFPPDNFITQLIQQKKLGVSLDETKDLIQTMVDVLPLKEDDPKRVQTEKAFAAACKKKGLAVHELASWSLQYTRDGAPLALALFRIALEQGDISSKYSYGVLLYRGARGVPADPAKGRAIIQALAQPAGGPRFKGLPWAMSTLASIYAREDKNYEAARDLYLKAAQAGILEARVALGRMYLNGELPQDLGMAKKYFQSAIQQSDDCAEAHFLLGALEMNQFTPEGKERTPNTKAAFQHYQKAASKGLAEAQYNVGQAYFTGLGVPKNDALAVEYWKMSGQQGFGLAQLSLGAYYFQDETPQAPSSTEADESKAERSVSSSSRAVKHVWDPSKKDLMQAQKWFTLASRRPGQLGLEGQRLKAQVDEAIKRGGGAKGGRMCAIM